MVFVTDSIPDGHIGELVNGFCAFAGRHHAEAISLAATRSGMSSILDGRSAYCHRPPYGIDRLYVSPAGERLHIIRNLPNGRQHMLDPDSGEIRATFGVNEKTGLPNHYIKQKQEQVALTSGDAVAFEIDRRLYRRHFIDGSGAYRIAHEFNLEAIPSPTGKKWNTSTITSILKNPIYLGRGIANRSSSAMYHRPALGQCRCKRASVQIPRHVLGDTRALFVSRRMMFGSGKGQNTSMRRRPVERIAYVDRLMSK